MFFLFPDIFNQKLIKQGILSLFLDASLTFRAISKFLILIFLVLRFTSASTVSSTSMTEPASFSHSFVAPPPSSFLPSTSSGTQSLTWLLFRFTFFFGDESGSRDNNLIAKIVLIWYHLKWNWHRQQDLLTRRLRWCRRHQRRRWQLRVENPEFQIRAVQWLANFVKRSTKTSRPSTRTKIGITEFADRRHR